MEKLVILDTPERIAVKVDEDDLWQFEVAMIRGGSRVVKVVDSKEVKLNSEDKAG